MSSNVILQFIASIENAVKSRIDVCRTPYYKVDGTIIGNGSQDFTKEHRTYSFSVNDTKAQLIDMPGIEGNEDKFKFIIENALKKCHLVCYVAREAKGIETATLERIKSYLGNTVEVIGIFNIPENPKKEYNGTNYTGEMEERIKCHATKESNLENSLLSVIPKELYSKTISVAALPGLCALALKDGNSTFAESLDYGDNESVSASLRRLSKQQQSFLLHSKPGDLYRISRLDELSRAIDESCKNTPSRIRRNAILRLLDAISDIYLDPLRSKVADFEKHRDKVVKSSNKLIQRLKYERIQMRRNMEHAVENAVYDYLRTEMLEKIVFKHIDHYKGIKKDVIERKLKLEKDRIETGLRDKVEEVVKVEINDYKDRIKKSTELWVDDMSRYLEELSVSIPTFDVEAFDWKEVSDWALSIGGYAFSGGAIGINFGGPIAAAICAVIGAIVGSLMKLVEWIMSDAKKINKAKSEAHNQFENTASEFWGKIKPSVTEISDKLSAEIDKLLNLANEKKKSAELTYNTILKFEKDMQALQKSIYAKLD